MEWQPINATPGDGVCPAIDEREVLLWFANEDGEPKFTCGWRVVQRDGAVRWATMDERFSTAPTHWCAPDPPKPLDAPPD